MGQNMIHYVCRLCYMNDYILSEFYSHGSDLQMTHPNYFPRYAEAEQRRAEDVVISRGALGTDSLLNCPSLNTFIECQF